MGAALQIAEVHHLPGPPKRKRKDGDGGGNDFARYARRIYQDERAGHESKELLFAFAYALTMPREDGDTPWTVARRCLGVDRIGRPRLATLFAADAPAYVSPVRGFPPDRDEMWKRCEAPRLRPFKEPAVAQTAMFNLLDDGSAPAPEPQEDFRNRLMVCGAEASDYAIELLPDTGWHKARWFCNRHRGELNRMSRQLAEPNRLAPKPIPNKGGLLPCYFDTDWLKAYRFYCGESWEPPVYGMRADDWPVPGVERVPMKARLRLAAVDGQLVGGA